MEWLEPDCSPEAVDPMTAEIHQRIFMSAAHKVLNIRDYQEDLDLLSPDIPELRARFQTVDFEVTRRCPWWVGKCPMVTNAIDWVVGADAAAVFLVHGLSLIHI